MHFPYNVIMEQMDSGYVMNHFDHFESKGQQAFLNSNTQTIDFQTFMSSIVSTINIRNYPESTALESLQFVSAPERSEDSTILYYNNQNTTE